MGAMGQRRQFNRGDFGMIIGEDTFDQQILNDLVTAISKLRNTYQSQDYVADLKKGLDNLLGVHAKCFSVKYTYNTDKLPFACVVFPILGYANLVNFLIDEEPIPFDKYEVEIDSKMFDYGLTDEQIVRVMLFNITSMIMELNNPVHLSEIVVSFFNKMDTCLNLDSSIVYADILKLGILDACNRLTSCLSLPDEFFDSHPDDELRDALKLLYHEMADDNNEVFRSSNLTMMLWSLKVYTNINHIDQEGAQVIRVLERAKKITASQLYLTKINMAIKAIKEPAVQEAVNESKSAVLTESSQKKGLLSYLKYNGLRNIEYDTAEFYNRALNDYTENDLAYSFKQINARLAIIDDYIRENPNDPELKRWIKVRTQYEEIRSLLARKKVDKSIQSVFVDYK